MSKKTAELSASLLAVKGMAAPAADMPGRAGPATAVAPSQAPVEAASPGQSAASVPVAAEDSVSGVATAPGEGNLMPLNFRISATFRREFKTYAARHDLKLNELLRLSFEAYRIQRGD
jgi:hypothetical protein